MNRKVTHSLESDLLAVFDEVHREGLTLRIQGRGHRGLGGPKLGIEYSMSAWDRVVAYEPSDLVATVEAGMTVSAVNQVLATHEQWIPWGLPDGKEDTVGGAIAAGVDGLWQGGYGPFRDRILGLRVLTPGFGAIQMGSRVVKSVAGYNLPRILIGTRGALGVITEVTVKVSPRPPRAWSWVWDGELAVLCQRAQELRKLAWPWACLSISYNEDGGYRLRAEWHGRRETVKTLATVLGVGGQELPLFAEGTWQDSPVIFRGAVPRTSMESLLKAVHTGYFAVEWQSGRFYGTSNLAAAKQLGSAVGIHQGVIQVLSGPDLGLSVPMLTGAWERLKKAFDPEHILG